MKRFFLICLFLFCVSSFSFAQQKITLFGGAGLSVPVSNGDFSNSFNAGYNLGIGLGLGLSSGNVVRMDIQYNNFPVKRGSSTSLGITSLRVDYLFGKFGGGRLEPYGLVGAGAYFLSIGGASETNFGFAFGGGVTTSLAANTSLFIEARFDYNTNEGDAKGFLPVKAGIVFGL